MLRWVCQQSPKSQTISQVFDSPMLIIKAVIEMTPEEEQLKIASGELFENLHSSTIVQSKNGGSKRGREVVNDECDFKNSKKQKSKSKMKKAIRNLQDRVGVVEGQLTSIKLDIDELKGMMSTILKHIGLQKRLGITLLIVLTLVVSYLGDEGDCKGFEGLVDHTLESEEVDNAKTEDVDTGGTPNWLRMPKEDDTSNGAKHIELKKKWEKTYTHFDSDVTEIEPFPTQRPHIWPVRRKRASVYLSTRFITLPKRSMASTTTTSQCEPIVYNPIHKILDVDLDRFRAWITDKRTNDEVCETFHGKKSKIFFRDLFMCRRWFADERILVAKWPQYKECIKENCPFDWKEEYKLVDYVVGSKKDFQDPWASVDYVYSPFNVHKPLGSIMLGFGKLSSQGMRFASVTYKCRRDEKHVIADLRVGAKFVR
ncbi:hypothetical protein IC582_005500 [Cucumis melo]